MPLDAPYRRARAYLGVPELGNIADGYHAMPDAQKATWDERIARLDIQDRLTWEGMVMGMRRVDIGAYIGEYIPHLVSNTEKGKRAVRRLCDNVNRQIGIERGEYL